MYWKNCELTVQTCVIKIFVVIIFTFTHTSQTVFLINPVTKCKQRETFSDTFHKVISRWINVFLNRSPTMTHYDKHATAGLWCDTLTFPWDLNVLSGIISAISLSRVIRKAFRKCTTPLANDLQLVFTVNGLVEWLHVVKYLFRLSHRW